MLTLVIVGNERLAAYKLGNRLQPFRRDRECSQRAGANGVRPNHRADARYRPTIPHALEDADGLVKLYRCEATNKLERPLDQREIVLPAIDQCQFERARCHCPILVARAVKKMPDGFCAGISAFLTNVVAS